MTERILRTKPETMLSHAETALDRAAGVDAQTATPTEREAAKLKFILGDDDMAFTLGTLIENFVLQPRIRNGGFTQDQADSIRLSMKSARESRFTPEGLAEINREVEASTEREARKYEPSRH